MKSPLLYRTFALSKPCETNLPVKPQQASFMNTQAVERAFKLLSYAPDLCALTPGQYMERRLCGKEQLKMALTLSLAEA